MQALRDLATQANLRLVTLRPNVYALLPIIVRPAAPRLPQATRGVMRSPSPASDATTPIVVIARYGDAGAAAMLSQLATAPVDIVSAETVQRLPATSAADALRLVPGLQFDNQRGNQVYLFARGLDPSFHLAKLDGRTVAINDLIENGTPMGRSFRFEMLPAELIDAVAVTKTNTTGDADPTIGITADIRTPRPLTLGRQVGVSVQQTSSALRTGAKSAVSGLASWVNDNRSFGVLALLARRDISVRNDRLLEFEWVKDRWPALFPAGTYTPGRVRPTIELEDRRQRSAFVALQWQPAPGQQLELTALRTRLDVRYDEYGLDIYPDDPTYNQPSFIPGTAKLAGNSVVAGTISNVRWMGSHETSLNRHDLLVTGARYSGSAAGWQWTADAGYSDAHSYHPAGHGTSRERIAFFAPLTFDFSGGYTAIPELSTTASLGDPATYQGWIYNYAPKDSHDIDASAKLELVHTVSSVVTALRGGVTLERRTRTYARRDVFLNDLVGVSLSDPRLAGAIAPQPVGDAFPDGAGLIPRHWLVPKAGALSALLLTRDVLGQPLTADDLAASYTIVEDVRAGYGALDLAGMAGRLPLSGTLAVRINQTSQRSSGYAAIGDVATPVSYARQYLVALPSAALRVEIDPSLVLRLAASRSVARPNLTDLAPRFTTSLENRTASGGNPELKPFTGTNVDLALSYYGAHGATASLTLFRRYLDNYLTSQNRLVDVPPYGTLTETIMVNGKAAIISGGEAVWSQAFTAPHPLPGRVTLDGSVTLSTVRSSFDAGNRLIRNALVGLSHVSLALRARYAWQRMSLDLGYFWRDRYLNTYGSSTIGEEYVAPLGTFDGQVSWAGPRHLRFSLSATNLMAARKYVYGVDPRQPKEINTFGRRLVLSVTWKIHPR